MDLAGDASAVVTKDPERPKTPPTVILEPVAENAVKPFIAKENVEGPPTGALPAGRDQRADGEPVRRILLPPPVPHLISDSDELWRKANRLAASLVEEQTKSMNGSLDTTLIFVSSAIPSLTQVTHR